jgi:hypothetical protein
MENIYNDREGSHKPISFEIMSKKIA